MEKLEYTSQEFVKQELNRNKVNCPRCKMITDLEVVAHTDREQFIF